jgi:hypothetical protein
LYKISTLLYNVNLLVIRELFIKLSSAGLRIAEILSISNIYHFYFVFSFYSFYLESRRINRRSFVASVLSEKNISNLFIIL